MVKCSLSLNIGSIGYRLNLILCLADIETYLKSPYQYIFWLTDD